MREGGAILKPTLAKVKGGNIMKNTLKKQTSHAFGKDVYLLGNNADGVAYWLEAQLDYLQNEHDSDDYLTDEDYCSKELSNEMFDNM